MAKVYVFTADGFEEIEGLTVVDLFRRAGAQTEMVSVSGSLSVKGSHGIEIKADRLFEDIDFQDADLLVLPGGMPGTLTLQQHSGLNALLRSFDERGKNIAAICAAPSILGGLGMLRGRKACSYPSFENKLEGAVVQQVPVVTDGHITTGRGMGAAIPFALRLTEILLGREKAEEIRKAVVYDV